MSTTIFRLVVPADPGVTPFMAPITRRLQVGETMDSARPGLGFEMFGILS